MSQLSLFLRFWSPFHELMSIRSSLIRFGILFLILLLMFLLPFVEGVNAQEILPLNQIKPGDKGYGLTVFSGEKTEKFDFEVIGIENNGIGGPYEILVLLSGGPRDKDGNEILEQTKVLQGMSGSPLFIGDKIIGAIASAPLFSLKAYAFATPIEDMVGFRPKILSLPNRFIDNPSES